MFHVALFEPEIPPNTGNIMRLCANTGCTLHLIEPLGFSLEEKQLRRAGLDYRDQASVQVHSSLQVLLHQLPSSRVFAISTKAKRHHSEISFEPDDVLLFGPETRGLPESLLDEYPDNRKLRIPMLRDSRSLNLSNAVSVVVYEAWRQLGYESGI